MDKNFDKVTPLTVGSLMRSLSKPDYPEYILHLLAQVKSWLTKTYRIDGTDLPYWEVLREDPELLYGELSWIESKAALLPDFNETQTLDMAVSAFPIGLDVFDNRQAYEAAADDNTRLEDGQVFAFNYIMARQKGLTKKEEEYFTRKEAFNLLCGEVVDIQWKDNGWRDSGFYVVTVRTKMGNVDAIIGKKQLAKPCEKGCYVLMEAMLVCKVLAIDGKTV